MRQHVDELDARKLAHQKQQPRICIRRRHPLAVRLHVKALHPHRQIVLSHNNTSLNRQHSADAVDEIAECQIRLREVRQVHGEIDDNAAALEPEGALV